MGKEEPIMAKYVLSQAQADEIIRLLNAADTSAYYGSADKASQYICDAQSIIEAAKEED